MSAPRSFILVGHCSPDGRMLRAAISRAAPEAQVHAVNDDASLEGHLSPASILLINRVLFGSFGNDSGIELIRRLHQGEDPPACILISNYEEAQAEALEAGAGQGFGKARLHDKETLEILRAAAGG